MANNSIKLGELHAVPTTEDLLFVLTTATKNKKTAELPFKNPYTGLTFSIKVAPATLQKPPHWTFARCSDSGDVVLWTRDSNEIMMIQGKVKIESNYSGVSLKEPQIVLEAQDLSQDNQEDAAPAQLAPWEKGTWHDPQWQNAADQEATRRKEAELQAPWQNTPEEVQVTQKAADPGAVWQNTTEHQAAFSKQLDPETGVQDEAWTTDPGAEAVRTEEEGNSAAETEHPATEASVQTAADRKPRSKKAAARAAKAAAKAAAGQATQAEKPATPEALRQETHPFAEESSAKTLSDSQLKHYAEPDPIVLPPPVTLHPEVLTNYLYSMSDPATGLLYHGAFEFFLLRDSEYSQKHGLKLSLLVFDFVDSKATDQANMSTGSSAIISGIMSEYCTPMELYTQLRTGEFAMLLCGYDGAGALNFAENLCARLPREQIELDALGDLKPLAMGVACMPEHCQDPGTLIAAAIAAKNLARLAKLSCMLFPAG